MIKISNAVVAVLQQRGLLPPDCRFVTIEIPATGAMILRFETYITDKSAAILSDAFAQIAADGRAAAARRGVERDEP